MDCCTHLTRWHFRWYDQPTNRCPFGKGRFGGDYYHLLHGQWEEAGKGERVSGILWNLLIQNKIHSICLRWNLRMQALCSWNVMEMNTWNPSLTLGQEVGLLWSPYRCCSSLEIVAAAPPCTVCWGYWIHMNVDLLLIPWPTLIEAFYSQPRWGQNRDPFMCIRNVNLHHQQNLCPYFKWCQECCFSPLPHWWISPLVLSWAHTLRCETQGLVSNKGSVSDLFLIKWGA